MRIAIVGAGTRGNALAKYIYSNNDMAEIVAVAEPNNESRDKFIKQFKIDEKYAFKNWEEMLENFFPCDAVVITTLDNAHTKPSVAFLEKGCHLLIEKPMADTNENCEKILEAQRKSGKIIAVCHTLRFDEGFSKVKMLVDQDKIGKIMTINQMEDIGNTRFAHNYVRGRWANENFNTFLLLHKSCHDLDYIAWLVGSRCKSVSSFGGLTYFNTNNSPPGSSNRCTDNCSFEPQCSYSAIKLYTEGDLTAWPSRDVCKEHTYDAHFSSIQTGPYGKCVWHADNNVVDHQVVIMEFENGATATFTMSGFTFQRRRLVQIQGTKGEITLDDSKKEILLCNFKNNHIDKISYHSSSEYHPEDAEIVNNWLTAIKKNNQNIVKVTPTDAFEKLRIVFAAEKSRLERRVVGI